MSHSRLNKIKRAATDTLLHMRCKRQLRWILCQRLEPLENDEGVLTNDIGLGRIETNAD